MKVISFCLYGTNKKYLFGAIQNAKLAEKIYPEFTCFFYYDNSVPVNIINALLSFKNTRLIDMSEKALPPMMWRFLAIDEEGVELFISRDADSRLTLREHEIVSFWIESPNIFMSIKDHPIFHRGVKLMGGLWGMKKKNEFKMQELVNNWLSSETPEDYYKYNLDQLFLEQVIYPLTKDSLSYYDNYNNDNLSFCQRIPLKRKKWEFIGEIFDENDYRQSEYRVLRGYHLRKLGLFGKVLARTINIFYPER